MLLLLCKNQISNYQYFPYCACTLMCKDNNATILILSLKDQSPSKWIAAIISDCCILSMRSSLSNLQASSCGSSTLEHFTVSQRKLRNLMQTFNSLFQSLLSHQQLSKEMETDFPAVHTQSHNQTLCFNGNGLNTAKLVENRQPSTVVQGRIQTEVEGGATWRGGAKDTVKS